MRAPTRLNLSRSSRCFLNSGKTFSKKSLYLASLAFLLAEFSIYNHTHNLTTLLDTIWQTYLGIKFSELSDQILPLFLFARTATTVADEMEDNIEMSNKLYTSSLK